MALSDGWRPLTEALLGAVEFARGEVARAAGVELEDARRLWQALGFAPVADARGGRVVKTIGDEVMFAADDAAGAAEIALGLVEAHTREPGLPDSRAGLARVTGP